MYHSNSSNEICAPLIEKAWLSKVMLEITSIQKHNICRPSKVNAKVAKSSNSFNNLTEAETVPVITNDFSAIQTWDLI